MSVVVSSSSWWLSYSGKYVDEKLEHLTMEKESFPEFFHKRFPAPFPLPTSISDNGNFQAFRYYSPKSLSSVRSDLSLVDSDDDNYVVQITNQNKES
jgi:hypothetical protein